MESLPALAAPEPANDLVRPAPYVRPALNFDVTAPRPLPRGHQSWFASSTGDEDAMLIASGSKEVNQQISAAELMPLGGSLTFRDTLIDPLVKWCNQRFDPKRGPMADVYMEHLNHYARARMTPADYKHRILNDEDCPLLPAASGVFGMLYNPISPLLKPHASVVVLGEHKPLWLDDMPDNSKLREEVRFTHAFFVGLHYWMCVNGRVMELSKWDPALPRYLLVVDTEDFSELKSTAPSSSSSSSVSSTLAQQAVGVSVRSFLTQLMTLVLPDISVAARMQNIHKNLVKFFSGRRFVAMRPDISVRDQYRAAVTTSIRDFESMDRQAVKQMSKSVQTPLSKSHVPKSGHEDKIGVEYSQSTPSVSLYSRVIRIEGNFFHSPPNFFAHTHFSLNRAPIIMTSDAGETPARIYWWTLLRYTGLSDLTKLSKVVPELSGGAVREPLELMVKGIRARYLCFRMDGSGVLNLAYPTLIHGQHAAPLGGGKYQADAVDTFSSSSSSSPVTARKRKVNSIEKTPSSSSSSKRGRKPVSKQLAETVDEAQEEEKYVPVEPVTGRIKPGPSQDFLPKPSHPSTFGPQMVTGRLLWRFMRFHSNEQAISAQLPALRALVQTAHNANSDYMVLYMLCHQRFGLESMALIGLLLMLRMQHPSSARQLMYDTELPVTPEHYEQAMHKIAERWDADTLQRLMEAREAMQLAKLNNQSVEDRRLVSQIRLAYSAQFPTYAAHHKLDLAHDSFLRHALTPSALLEFVMSRQSQLRPVYCSTGVHVETAPLTKMCAALCKCINDKCPIARCLDPDLYTLCMRQGYIRLGDKQGVAMFQHIIDTWTARVQLPIMWYAAHVCNPLYGPVLSTGCQWVAAVRDSVKQTNQQDESKWAAVLGRIVNHAADKIKTKPTCTALFRQKRNRVEYKQDTAAAALLMWAACEKHIAEAKRNQSSDARLPIWKEISDTIRLDRSKIKEALTAFLGPDKPLQDPAPAPVVAAPAAAPTQAPRNWMHFLDYLSASNLLSSNYMERCVVLIFETEHSKRVLDCPLSAIGAYLAVLAWNNSRVAANVMQFILSFAENPKDPHAPIAEAYECTQQQLQLA